MIQIILQGGQHTAQQVIDSVKKKIPCIFVNKSGRFSDIFSFIYNTVEAADKKDKKKESVFTRDPQTNKFRFSNGLLAQIDQLMRPEEQNLDTNKDIIVQEIEEIFQPEYRHLLSVFDLNIDKNAGKMGFKN